MKPRPKLLLVFDAECAPRLGRAWLAGQASDGPYRSPWQPGVCLFSWSARRSSARLLTEDPHGEVPRLEDRSGATTYAIRMLHQEQTPAPVVTLDTGRRGRIYCARAGAVLWLTTSRGGCTPLVCGSYTTALLCLRKQAVSSLVTCVQLGGCECTRRDHVAQESLLSEPMLTRRDRVGQVLVVMARLPLGRRMLPTCNGPVQA